MKITLNGDNSKFICYRLDEENNELLGKGQDTRN